MKTVYITYKQNGVIKQSSLTEDNYNKLINDSTISQLTMYPSMYLMEMNYKKLTSNPSSNKKIIYG